MYDLLANQDKIVEWIFVPRTAVSMGKITSDCESDSRQIITAT